MSYQILQGDCLEVLKTLESESVQTCVTSPPYYGLRDYGVEGQIGLEETPQAFVVKMVEVFEEVRRVLKPDGTLWLNLGDTYAAHKDCKSISQTLAVGTKSEQAHVISKGLSRSRDSRMLKANGFKNKDLIGVPWRVAFALQEAGWWLRQDIIWAKPNPMPESVTDRCTKAHEYIFLLTKSAKYYYDNEAIKEKVKDSSVARLNQTSPLKFGGNKYGDNPDYQIYSGKQWKPQHKNVMDKGQQPNSFHLSGLDGMPDAEYLTANKRSVWSVNTKPYSEAHFATFPPKLIEPCILAGSREGDTVLDPFNGSGTTGLVSLQHRRNYIGIELNPAYIEITKKRLREVQVELFV